MVLQDEKSWHHQKMFEKETHMPDMKAVPSMCQI